jgi:hypothetical protein
MRANRPGFLDDLSLCELCTTQGAVFELIDSPISSPVIGGVNLVELHCLPVGYKTFLASRLTVCVTRGWAGGDNATSTEPAWSQKTA